MKSAVLSLLLLGKQASSSGAGWDYHSPEHWYATYSMCDNQDQSPIDIIPDEVVYDESICTTEFEWDVDYTVQTFKITNNGHSIVLKACEATTVDPDYDLDNTFEGVDATGNSTEYITLAENDDTIAHFPNYFQPDGSEHDSFCLDSFHFHWGTSDTTGSEHLVDGEQFPLEVHFVHYSCQHSSLGSCLTHFPDESNITLQEDAGEDTHQLGVVGIFFDIVEDEVNPAFEAIFEQLSNLTLPGASNLVVTGLDLSELIPEDITTAGYYAYEGSLTTPPCTNIVRWHVMNARGWIGASQIEQFRALMSEADTLIAPNYRPVQQNVNTVYGCMEYTASEEESSVTILSIIIGVFSLLTPITLGVICCHQAKKEQKQAEDNNQNSNTKNLKKPTKE